MGYHDKNQFQLIKYRGASIINIYNKLTNKLKLWVY